MPWRKLETRLEMLSEGDYWGELSVVTIGPDYIGLSHIDSEPVIFIQSNNKNVGERSFSL